MTSLGLHPLSQFLSLLTCRTSADSDQDQEPWNLASINTCLFMDVFKCWHIPLFITALQQGIESFSLPFTDSHPVL